MGKIEKTSHLPLTDIPQQKIAITATFTSEPIEDSLSYWLEQIGVPGSIEFAPYNQVFQEILNPASILAQNQNGVNVILVRFEDWSGANNRLQLIVDNESQTQITGDRSVHTLPNHLEIAHLNQYETEYLYQEIFVDRVYSRHGIVFKENDCIVDVGANIGLFTLFAQQKSPKGSIYSFEPAPHAFDKLQTNAQLYCENTHLFNCGLGGEHREETFTFYPRSSVFSSFAADTEEDEKAIRSVIVNMLQRDHSLDEESLERIADDFLEDRLEKETYQAQIRTLSEIIEEYEIAKIDLLKLDAEKSELAILQGIKDHHWSLIKQIVMEVHDPEGSTLKQVMDLLEDKGFQFVVDEESMLHGSGLFNIYATRLNQKQSSQSPQVGENASQIEQNVRDFGSALKTARSRSQTPYLICICPPSTTNGLGNNILHQRMEDMLAAELQDLSGLYLIKSQELTSSYPVEDYYDPYGDELGHIPYTPTFFSALGTMVARKIFAWKSPPYKVIVLDCDQTLWKGVCGEEGVAGVKIDPPYRRLQEFIIEQQAAGKLICLCSKNQEEDVFAVFDEHPDMLLKRSHLVNWRINWEAKSENLQSLATELQLGLDSFIFIDDNPVECAEVKANCPEVLTLQLPETSDRIPQFLEHIWAFDQLQTTKEDQARTNLYQQNVQRQRFQEASLSFSDFLAQLNLEIEISPLQTEQLARAAQLTQRTNQFNLTTIRRSETQIQQLCNSEKFECQVVKVKDRFGDYGLVGLLLFETQKDALFVDTFLLSCRVLGRGVEHKMLAHLGTLAQEKGLQRVELVYKPTQKNQPIQNFLDSVGQQFQQEKDDAWQFNFPSQVASSINFIPISEEQKNIVSAKDIVDKNATQKAKDKSNGVLKRVAYSDFLEHIARNLYSPELIFKEITAQKQRQRPQLDIEFIAPRTPLEKAIADLFAEVLNLEQVGINDNFFELGGDSIQGAILINKLQGKLKEIIHFVVLFDTKTVKKLAVYLEKNYPQTAAKLLGQEIDLDIAPQEQIDEEKVLKMRSLIPALTPQEDNTSKNPPAIFILSPHRSGSTLLRVMLGGNPQLFAPPELELLKFNTLGERQEEFSGRYSFWGEGTIRTIMEIRGCSAEEAIALMEELSAKNLTTKEFYRLIQEWLGDKILVDKTPSYSIDLETLKRAEIDFQNPIYIHLMRHPYGTMRSYEEARVEQTFPYQHPFNSRELAELVWLISHQNILEFLGHVPPERQYQVKFEDIVSQPQTTVEGICQFLGVDFHPDMLQPYQEKKQRMTDGIYADSRMLGDVKFHQHQSINPSTADSWQDYYNTDFLGDLTWQIAEYLGYSRKTGAIPQIRRENPAKSQAFPVSFAQQRLWFLAQLEPDSPFYNMFRAVRLNGRINTAVLERSLNEIIRRHEVLRTNFDVVEGKPVQVIAPQATIKPVVIDLQGLSEQEQSEQLQRLATQDQLQPFNLTQGLLLRVTLVQLQSESFALLLTMHHIIGDGWSLGVLIKELSSLYQSFLLGEPVSLTELPIQYADFTIWQRRWLQGKTLQTQINYWQQQLADAPPLLELPTDRPRPSVQTFRGQCFSFQLDAKLTASLKELSHKSGTTLFMTLMAAYATLMFRYSGQEDILIGTPIANRNHQDLEQLIGFFVNTLVMRTRLEDNPSFSELLKQVRGTSLDAYANQDVPFEQIVETLQIERSLSHSPLFQVVFALQNTPIAALETAELEIDPLNLDNVNAKLDLTLQMWETNTDQGNCLEGFWQYNTDLFDQERIARMTGHFQTLLAGIVANPQESVDKLPLLTEREQHQLLESWNDTYTAYPDRKCIHQLFEEQVEQNPDNLALVFEGQNLTYQQLNQKANQLAHYLKKLEVKPDTLVGICVERSFEMIIGLLGILKAGAAYVPIDPNYPDDRIQYLLEDSGTSILLTQSFLQDQLPIDRSKNSCQVIYLDQSNFDSLSSNNLAPQSKPSNLAYVIYTSGSTGRPKGVMIEHQGLTNITLAIANKFQIKPDTRLLQTASFSFDMSVAEIATTLLTGACLYLIKKEILLSGQTLVDFLSQHKISHIILSPSLLSTLPNSPLPDLQNIGVGGEAVSAELVKQWAVKQNLINGYGPTESTICATMELCKPNGENPPIGKPLANLRVYILDANQQILPPGIPGELCIAGVGLARGYLNRPDLTAEKFINVSLFGKTERIYKTGDLAQWNFAGNLEYLGRIDNQVKIRGFRIELGEIEAALSQQSDVQASCVIAREDIPEDKRLVAYIVPQPAAIPTSRELRQFLKDQLPDYMVPSAFVILEFLPLTPSGKVDRRALPEPDLSEGLDEYVAPRTPTEEMLAQIWGQVLKVEQVGINDNFFELGGHSLLATQLVSRIRNTFQVELPLRELFASGTIAQLADSIGQLQQQNQGLAIPPISVRGEEAELSLSYAQQRLWFLDQLEPNSALYNIPIALRLEGTINISALEQSLQTIIERHEALRTNFASVDGEPTPIIHSETPGTISVVDLSHLSTAEQQTEAQQLAQQEANQPFDLAREALIRVTLVQLNETEQWLLLCMHHIVSDGWSMTVLTEELAALYQAYDQGQPSPLMPLPIQYTDFAIWQREWLQADILQRQLSYWQQQLADIPELLVLPTDRPRPAVQTFVGAHQEFRLSGELTSGLKQLSTEQGVTLFMTLLTAFDILLYRYSGQKDILIGSPIANRNYSQIEGLIGFFVNTLVLRTQIEGNPSFSELQAQVKEIAMDAYGHQDLPFEMLVEALQPERDLSYTPLFQVMFILHNDPLAQVELTGLTASPLQVETKTSKFDLTLSMENRADSLVGVWSYSTDLFDASTIERMTRHFVTLLEGIVANPQAGIAQLSLLREDEQRQLLVEWNDTEVDYPQSQSIHQLFEEQVERTPDAVAVVFEKQQLTYRELNSRANQLARYLQSLGVSPDALVGICVERSPLMVVGILGILKAGGAYVPLDPEYPTERLSFMLEDAQVKVLLTQQHLLERVSEHQTQILCLDTHWHLISQLRQSNLISNMEPSDLAYVIYTSGSSGQPKGVAMKQLALRNLLLWQLEHTKLARGPKTLQFAPISFDVSFQEIFSTWCSGGTLLLITEELRRDPVALLGLLQEKAVERLFLPFVGLQQLAEEASDSALVLNQLQEIITAGEQLQITPAIYSWLSKLTSCTLHNHYGPSESHVVTTFTLTDSVDTWPMLPPIGRPIANTQIYILDQYLQPVPVGVAGELYIGGAALARGYLNRPELTQERFIPNPFNNSKFKIQNSKLYKTGDLARYLPDGNIEYLGRIDNQVKIRGFRIELGEIEAALSQQSEVQASCVIAREDTPGNKRLVAYIMPQPAAIPTSRELRQFLKDQLPDYMVPSAFVILETLPLTPSGKVDRRALPAPDFSEGLDEYVAPRTQTEEMLAQIWGQVLKVEQVGINDNFFELGGHSLLATQLVSRIRNTFQVELPLRELFSSGTIAQLADSIGQLQQQNQGLVIPPILPQSEGAELSLSYAQQRLWFLDQLKPNSALYNIPIALRLEGTINISALEQSLQTIIERHEALRTNFLSIDGEPTPIIHEETPGTISVVDLTHLSSASQQTEAQQLSQQQANQPFDLASDPLIRVTLVRLNETEQWLLLCMHHIVSDGWSMTVLTEELAALYQAYDQGQSDPLMPLPIQYTDFAIWQREWLQADILQRQLSYWQQQLADAPELLVLPTDRPRPAVQTFVGAHQEFRLSGELTSGLKQLSTEQGVTLFMTLLTAFDILLYRYSGQKDILIGSPIANRNYSQIEGLIGFFVNTLVLRTTIEGNPSFSELLTQVREIAMDAYAHQDLPFEMLVEALQPQRDLSYTPLFQVMFTLQNQTLSQVDLRGLTVNPLKVEAATSKFDLTLGMENRADGLVGVWAYSTDLFDASTIERMTGHFVTLLEGIVANPQEKISQLPILTEDERRQLLVEWNNTQVDYPQAQCIHQLFEQQVEKTPDAVAVVFEEQQLTYQQLNSRANQLAHYLRQNHQIKPDTLIGICVERSLEMIVGIMGILKAGAAYVPLDPNYPPERLSFMLEDAQVSVILTQQQLRESLTQHRGQVICLDRDWETIAQSSKSNPNHTATLDNLAYIIYTSGSTGKPKGVLVNHSNVVRLFAATEDWYNFNQQDVWTLFHSYAFDFSVWEIWGALLHGGRLIVVPYLVTRSPESFYRLLCQEQVTILNQTPSAFRQLIQAEQGAGKDLDQDLKLRLVIFGGEALEIKSLQPWWERHGDQSPQLVNMYGITETTVHVTYRPLSIADLQGTASVIGRPIPDLQVYLLDSYLQPVPIGVSGEMYVGGAGVARGYLKRPELTAERFISSPFNNSKLYKTGDVARYLPNGDLEYLGRVDNQVKLRGFRIELGEIEALLASHPQVWETVVLVREDTPGDQRLVAYLVPQPEKALKIEEIRQFMKAKLPDYMVPNAFVILETLPLTTNGKVNRRALPQPDVESERLDKYVAPCTPTEEKLATIWEQILKVEQVGINDNFFELGGHSLLVTQLVSRIRDTFKIEIPLRDLFTTPTVSQLAKSIEHLKQQNSKPINIPAIIPRRKR